MLPWGVTTKKLFSVFQPYWWLRSGYPLVDEKENNWVYERTLFYLGFFPYFIVFGLCVYVLCVFMGMFVFFLCAHMYTDTCVYALWKRGDRFI